MKIPKVLIIGQPFNNETGGGITLSNLFSGWGSENLAIVCSPYLLNGNTNTEACDNYYQLGHKEHLWVFPFNVLSKKYHSGPFEFKNQTSISSRSTSMRAKFVKGYLNPFLKWTGFANSISTYRLSEELCHWLDEFGPDVIYAQAQRRDSVLLCTKIQKYLQKPMVFHMMDDWVELIAQEGIFGKYWANIIDREFKEMLDTTSLHLSISEPMSVEYKRRYGYNFKTFHNPIDLDFWKKKQRQSYELGKEVYILYAGRVGLGINDSLEKMAKAVEILNLEFDVSVRFVLQVSKRPSWMDRYKNVLYRGFVPYDELPAKFAEADILYMPYDFSVTSLKFIKYSMPTKASEYMVSGTPILIFSPNETAIVKYANEYKWAKVVTENNLEAVVQAVRSLLMNREEREWIAANAVKLAEEKHNSDKVRENFKQELLAVVRAKNKAIEF